MSSLASLMSYVGPKAEAFVRDQRLLTAIMGPYGSAKTTSCIRKAVFEIPQWLTPGPDGIIRHRGCVVRDTYAQLETNVLNSWFSWFPKTKENWNGREMCQRLRYSLIDAATGKEMLVEMEVYFRAMGDQKAEDVLKGMELTWLWLNETDTLNEGCWLFGFGRIGRYPAMKDGGCAWRGVFCDFNAPDIENWTYKLLVEADLGLTEEQEAEFRKILGSRFGIGFHRQPSGLSKDPPPENIANLPTGYYEGQAMAFANQPDHLRRFVHNEFGYTRQGQLVLPEFNAAIHVAESALRPLPGLPILAGLDGGRTPAILFAQEDGSQLRVLDELVIFDPEKKGILERLGPTAFAETARTFVGQKYPNNQFGIGFYDPSCDWGEFDDDGTWIELFAKVFGGKWKPGGPEGNRLEPRFEAMRSRYNRMPGGRPAILVSPTCKVFIKGAAGGYVYEHVKTSSGFVPREKPAKTPESHVQEAGQYLALGLDTHRGRIIDDMDARGAARRKAGPRVEYSRGYFSPSHVQGVK